MKLKVAVIIAVRVSSTRLPNKALKPIMGKSMLEHIVSRVKSATTVDDVIIAIPVNESENIVENMCIAKGWHYFRGNYDDVLDRVYQASKYYGADMVVRITADCPLMDSWLIDEVVGKFLSLYPDIDYVSNLLPRTYPRGLDIEVVNFSTLEKEWQESTQWREHVTLNIRKNAGKYKIANVSNKLDFSFMRWTVDTPEDLEFIRKIYGHFKDKPFTWKDVILLLGQYPEWVIKDTQEDPR